MSRQVLAPPARQDRFPRVSGDEPLQQIALCASEKFSPRERG